MTNLLLFHSWSAITDLRGVIGGLVLSFVNLKLPLLNLGDASSMVKTFVDARWGQDLSQYAYSTAKWTGWGCSTHRTWKLVACRRNTQVFDRKPPSEIWPNLENIPSIATLLILLVQGGSDFARLRQALNNLIALLTSVERLGHRSSHQTSSLMSIDLVYCSGSCDSSMHFDALLLKVIWYQLVAVSSL